MHKHHSSLLFAAAAEAVIATGIDTSGLPPEPAKRRKTYGRGHHGSSTKTKPMRQRKHAKRR